MKSETMRYFDRLNYPDDISHYEISDFINHIIQNNQINKINQVKLAHHRTDFGLLYVLYVFYVLWKNVPTMTQHTWEFITDITSK